MSAGGAGSMATIAVEPGAHRPARMDQGELLVAVAGFLNQRGLQGMGDHA